MPGVSSHGGGQLMGHNDDVKQMSGATDQLARAEKAEPDAPAAGPKDGEVPPSGALPPDPTGLGALA
jgi:hypothetical protein